MSDRVFVTLCGVAGLLLLAGSAPAFRCNLRAFRRARTTAPLDGVDLGKAAILPIRAPSHWPQFDEIADARVAAAYASLADDRLLTCVLAGEALLVVGGGVMGVAISKYGQWRGVPVLVAAVAITLLGVVVRLLGSRRWAPVYARYREVYQSLSVAPLPPARRRGLLSGLFRR